MSGQREVHPVDAENVGSARLEQSRLEMVGTSTRCQLTAQVERVYA